MKDKVVETIVTKGMIGAWAKRNNIKMSGTFEKPVLLSMSLNAPVLRMDGITYGEQ